MAALEAVRVHSIAAAKRADVVFRVGVVVAIVIEIERNAGG